MVAPEDVGRAGCWDLSALRVLRDHWFDFATGERTSELMPESDALAQFELLSELAAGGGGEAEDQVMLMIAYQTRVMALTHDQNLFEQVAADAVAAGNEDEAVRAKHWLDCLNRRRDHYQAKVDGLVSVALNEGDGSTAALVVAVMDTLADSGNDMALSNLQWLLDSVTPERASVIQEQVRKIEGVSIQ